MYLDGKKNSQKRYICKFLESFLVYFYFKKSENCDVFKPVKILKKFYILHDIAENGGMAFSYTTRSQKIRNFLVIFNYF